MAKVMLFCVRDSASESYMRPVPAVATGQATRSFSDEVNAARENNAMYDHPEDFELYLVGEFDDVRGVLLPAPEGPILIVRGKDVSRRISNAS